MYVILPEITSTISQPEAYSSCLLRKVTEILLDLLFSLYIHLVFSTCSFYKIDIMSLLIYPFLFVRSFTVIWASIKPFMVAVGECLVIFEYFGIIFTHAHEYLCVGASVWFGVNVAGIFFAV